MTDHLTGCEKCLKPADLCICSIIQPMNSRFEIVILQHPQEPDKLLGSARIAHLALLNSRLKVGLSWPNLRKAVDRDALGSEWAVLHLGSGLRSEDTGDATFGNLPRIILVDKKGVPLANQAAVQSALKGIIVLDGTWSQAKALWWRNPWLLKLRRAVLLPDRPSQYRELRKEPRRECLSTIESIALSLKALSEPPEVSAHLEALFGQLLGKYRARRQERR